MRSFTLIVILLVPEVWWPDIITPELHLSSGLIRPPVESSAWVCRTFLCVVIYLVYWSSVCIRVALLIIGAEVIKQGRLFKHSVIAMVQQHRVATMYSDHKYC